jgi:hypothetical protein
VVISNAEIEGGGDFSGEGIKQPNPVLQVEVGHTSFTVVPGGQTTGTFTVTNVGTGSLIGTIALSGDSRFSIFSGGNPFTLGAGQAQSVTVEVQGAVLGAAETITATLTVNSNGGNEEVELEARLPHPSIAVFEPTSSFGPLSNGEEQERTFRIENLGNGTFTGTVGITGDTQSRRIGPPYTYCRGL